MNRNFSNFTKILSQNELLLLQSVHCYKDSIESDAKKILSSAKQESNILLEDAKNNAQELIQEAQLTIEKKLAKTSQKLVETNDAALKALSNMVVKGFNNILAKSCLGLVIKDQSLVGEYVLKELNKYFENVNLTITANAVSLEKLKLSLELKRGENKNITYIEDNTMEDMKFIASDYRTSVYLDYEEVVDKIVGVLMDKCDEKAEI